MGRLLAVLATIPDLVRLCALPVFGWAAVRDIRTRRVPNRTWYPLLVVGVAALLIEAVSVLDATPFEQRLYLIRVGISLGLVIPLAYFLWWVGGFGGADAKAFMTIALVFPTFPLYNLFGESFPLVETAVGVFSLTIITNTVLLGIAYPLVLGIRNLLVGQVSRVSFLGLPVHWSEIDSTHGKLLETPSGFTRAGLDLDALRMYLRWRETTLGELRANDGLRDPDTLPAESGEPTDGAVQTDGGQQTDASEEQAGAVEYDDPWGAGDFLEEIDSTAYGTSAQQLRNGLDLLVEREHVWVSPGIPFLVPTALAIVFSMVYGDLLFTAMQAAGLVP